MTEKKQETPQLPEKFRWFIFGVISAFILVLLAAKASGTH